MALAYQDFQMKTYKNLYQNIYSLENLFLAWKKARKGKQKKIMLLNLKKI